MITGEFKSTLDEKGRLLIPSRLRGAVPGTVLIATRGVDPCLWLFPPDQWKAFSEQVIESTSIFKSQARVLQRRIIAPAHDCEIDKAGRITILPALREGVKLKKEVVILGMMKYIEIWDKEVYRAYEEQTQEEFREASEKLGEFLSF